MGPEMLKIWGDRYAFPVESKGINQYDISPKVFVFTSNYSLVELLEGAGFSDPILLAALTRRITGLSLEAEFPEDNDN